MKTNKQYMTLLEASNYLNVNNTTLSKRIREGKLSYDMEIGYAKFFLRSKILALKRENIVESSRPDYETHKKFVKKPTKEEMELLDDYIQGGNKCQELRLKLGLYNRQRLSQVMQAIAYRHYVHNFGKKKFK